MKIKLNNRDETFENLSSLTISEVIKLKNFTFKFLAVRLNGKPVKPNDFDTTIVNSGDNLIVMHLISGG